MLAPGQVLIHASSVSINDLAVVIRGASGTGKSALALHLMALGGALVADDRTVLSAGDNAVIAHKPETLPNMIEARGIGLLPAHLAGPTEVSLIVDLDQTQTIRLPRPETQEIFGQSITVWRKITGDHFPAAIFHYLSHMSDPRTQIQRP